MYPPRAAFHPVKRRNKRQVPSAQQPSATPSATTLPAQSPMADTLVVSVGATSEVPPVEQRTVPTHELGELAILTDIRKSLSTLSAPPAVPVVQAATPVQAAVPIVPLPALQGQGSSIAQVPVQYATMQALLAVAQLLANIHTSVTPVPPTTPWATNDTLKTSMAELKRQVEAIAAARSATSAPSEAAGPSVTLAPGQLPLAPTNIEKSKVTESNNNMSGAVLRRRAGEDTLVFRPGKFAAHVGSEVKEKIWKGEFVEIFSLIRARRREIKVKEKEGKALVSSDKKPKVKENITNWLFGFNVFLSVMLEKKPELAISMICYAKKIFRAHHMYGGNSWLEYDRDFRWAKVEDPGISWDQTEVNIWLECVNSKLPGKQPLHTQYSSAKKVCAGHSIKKYVLVPPKLLLLWATFSPRVQVH
ncbi:hypothetical protein NDU88_002489 [Pleurodeles waltl]|uniref:Uncharacterized protein n=1 Tax=Pleurodeles waltl TaxID=8319 RepID=A0AAV7UXV7_PLEWA|nr:hypothetical protein NDU88_002489 [Pleurodeles waltl]